MCTYTQGWYSAFVAGEWPALLNMPLANREKEQAQQTQMQGGRNSPSRVAAHCTCGKASAPNWRWAQPTYLAREAAKSKLPRCSVCRAACPLNSLKWKAFAFIFKTLHVLAKRCLGERLSVWNKNLLRMRSLLCLLQGWCHSNSSQNLKMTAGEEGGCICFGKRGFIYFFS